MKYLGNVELVQTNKIGVGTSTFGTNHKLLINPYNTVDNLAVAQVNAAVATAKGLVIQGYASQSANLLELQSNAGAILTSVSKDGYIGIGTGSPNFGLDMASDIRVRTGKTIKFGGTGAADTGMYMEYDSTLKSISFKFTEQVKL